MSVSHSLPYQRSQVTSPRLERVRLLKSRLVRLTTRVETVREVLEKFLDDDDDMHDLNLTANESKELAETQPNVSGRGRGFNTERLRCM